MAPDKDARPVGPKDLKGPKRRRTGTPRSRGGCFTCRRRKVKCDESLPYCERCVKLGVACEGYKSPPPDKRCRQILPNIESKTDLMSQPSGQFAHETDLENRYLRHFQKATSIDYYSTMDWSLWNRLVLQTSHHEPFVRHSVIAIGALNKSLQMTYPWKADGLEHPADPKTATLHREFAYVEYGKAIRLMRGVLDSTANPRQALLACLLVVCFETFLGDRFVVFKHGEIGLRILRQWKQKNFAWSTDKLMSTKSPAPEIVEDEIVEAFANLDIKISTIVDSRPHEIHQQRIEEESYSVAKMPAIFSDLQEARRYWNTVMRRMCHFLATTWPETKSLSLARNFDKLAPSPEHIKTGHNVFSTPYEVTDEIRIAQKIYSTEVSSWSMAFEPLYNGIRSCKNVDIRKYIVTSSLRIQAIAASILIAGVVYTEEVMYDKFYPQFQEMLDLMDMIAASRRRVADYSYWDGGFLIDLGVVPCLFVTVLRCRDRDIRSHAIEILRGWQLEGCWDPKLIAQIGQFMMDVEEEGRVDGQIPERSRAIFSGISHDTPRRVALLQCVLRHGGPNGEIVWREKELDW